MCKLLYNIYPDISIQHVAWVLIYGKKTNKKSKFQRGRPASKVVKSGLHVEAKEEMLPRSWTTSVLDSGNWVCEDNPYLVEAHDLNHPCLEVENLLVADAHAGLLYHREIRSLSAWRLEMSPNERVEDRGEI